MRHFQLLALLADGKFHSGAQLGRQLGVSRTIVWSELGVLKKLGVDIFSVRGKGYRLAEPLQLLDQSLINRMLADHTREQLHTIQVVPEIHSTNAYLMEYVQKHNDLRPSVLIAEHQTKGRGRRGKTWVSPPGQNIYLSILWPFAGGVGALEGLSLVIGIAKARALQKLGFTGVGIKWPNDLYWQQRKLGGILLELTGEAVGPCAVVMGVGLNVNMQSDAAKAVDQPWVSLRDIQRNHVLDRNPIVAILIDELVSALKTYEKQGFAPFQQSWQTYDLTFKRPINVHMENHTVQGYGAGIDKRGALLVNTAEGQQTLFSGEVSIRLRDEVKDEAVT